MWQTEGPKPVKLIVGILAATAECLGDVADCLTRDFGRVDLASEVWPFTQTDYYKQQTGENIVRQFLSFEKLIAPGSLAGIKHRTNQLEQALSERSATNLARPVNLDPGIIEPSKLVLASTKNFSHRIYIGQNMYAEVTLTYSKGTWRTFEYTFGDYRQNRYHDFFSLVRQRLTEQLKNVSGTDT